MTDTNVLATTPVAKKLTASMELHSMAHKHPLMSAELYMTHADSIREDGQMVAVTLYRGKIVDGRHRLKALKEAGIETILVKELPNNWTLARVEKLVLTSEIRRHQSPTQLAIKGYDYYKDNKVTQSEAAEATGSRLSTLKRVIQLDKLGRIDLINRLRNGDEIDVSTDTRFNTMTDSLAAVVAMAKRQHDIAEKEIIVYEESEENEVPVATTTEEDQVTIDIVKLATKGKSKETIKKVVAALYEELEGR